MSSAELANHLAHFQHRVIQDALNEATRVYWLRRAEEFERAKPTLGEFHGNATDTELRRQWNRADETACACRNRAAMALIQDEDPGAVIDALGVVWGAPAQGHLTVVA